MNHHSWHHNTSLNHFCLWFLKIDCHQTFFHERAWSRPLAGHKAPTIIPGLCLCGVKVTIKMQKPMKDDVCVPAKTIFTKMQWADLGHRLLFGYPCSRVTLNRGLFCFVFPSFKWTGSRSLADCENLLPLECFMK